MTSISEKNNKAKKLIQQVMNALDKSGINTERYNSLFKELEKKSQTELYNFLKSIADSSNEFFYLETLPYKNEPGFSDIEEAADILNIPLEEYVYIKNTESGKTIRSREKAIVGYLPIKRLQQLLIKKSGYNLDINVRSAKTGQIAESDKVGRISDSENYTLSIMGANHFLKEALGPRADSMEEKMQMYKSITNEGYVNLSDLSSNIESHTTLNTINVYMLGAGVLSDLVTDSLALPRTMKEKNK